MFDKNNKLIVPDATKLVECDGEVYLTLAFNHKKDNISIKLEKSDVKTLAEELNMICKKHLIASEYIW